MLKLAGHGIDRTGKRARQPTRSDYDECGLLIGMDRANHRIFGGDVDDKKRCLLVEYTDRPSDVAEPRYTDDFETAWWDVPEVRINLLGYLKSEGKVC